MTPEERYEANRKLVFYVLSKKFPQSMFDEDMQQIGRIGLWKACNAFDEGGNASFFYYALTVIYNEICKELRRQTCAMRKADTISLYDNGAAGEDSLLMQELIPGDKDVTWLDEEGLWSAMNDVQKKILLLRLKGFSQDKIAEAIGRSQHYVHNRLTEMREVFDSYI